MSSWTRTAVVLTVAIVLSTSARAVSEPDRNPSAYALLAGSELTGSFFDVTAGDVGVNAGRLRVSRTLAATGSRVVADSTDLGSSSSCAALLSNHPLDDTAAACGPAMPFSGPIVADLAAGCGFPAETFPSCDPNADHTVPLHGALHLAPGTYGDVMILGKNPRTGGVLLLKAGVYASAACVPSTAPSCASRAPPRCSSGTPSSSTPRRSSVPPARIRIRPSRRPRSTCSSPTARSSSRTARASAPGCARRRPPCA